MLTFKQHQHLVAPRNPTPAIIAIFSPLFPRWNYTLKIDSVSQMIKLAWRISIMSPEKQEGILHLFISAVPSQEQIRIHYGKAIQMHTFKENTFVSSTNGKANAVRKLLSVTQHSMWKNKLFHFFQSNTFKFLLKLSYRFSLITFHLKKHPPRPPFSVHWICFKKLEHTGLCLTTSEYGR